MRKLFETNKRVTNIRAPNAQMILTKTTFLANEQFQPPDYIYNSIYQELPTETEY